MIVRSTWVDSGLLDRYQHIFKTSYDKRDKKMSIRVAETGKVMMHINGVTHQYVRYIGFTSGKSRRVVQYLPIDKERGNPQSYETIITIEAVTPEQRELIQKGNQASRYQQLDVFTETSEACSPLEIQTATLNMLRDSRNLLIAIHESLKPKKKR